MRAIESIVSRQRETWMVFERAIRGYTLLFPCSIFNSAALTPLPPVSHFTSFQHLVSIWDEITGVRAASTTSQLFSQPLVFSLHCVAHFQAVPNGWWDLARRKTWDLFYFILTHKQSCFLQIEKIEIERRWSAINSRTLTMTSRGEGLKGRMQEIMC